MGRRAPGSPLSRGEMYYLFVEGKEKSVKRRLERATRTRKYPIKIVSEYPGYLMVDASKSVPKEVLLAIFKACGAKKVLHMPYEKSSVL